MVDTINGVAGLQTLSVDSPFATPEQRLGDPVDPKHAHRGETSRPSSWQSQIVPGAEFSVRDPDAGFFEEHYFVTLPADNIDNSAPYWDTVPWTHNAPWPDDPIGDGTDKPDNVVRQLQDNYSLRQESGRDGFADPSQSSYGMVNQDSWMEIWNVTSGHVDLSTVPGQIKSGAAPGGRGSTDPTQTYAKQNEYGFDSAHMHRRYATGSVPGNYMYLIPGGRPLIKSLAGPARPPIGPGSQFEGQDLGASFDYGGAILQQPASEYTGPPQPYVAPAQTYSDVDNSPPSWDELYGVYS